MSDSEIPLEPVAAYDRIAPVFAELARARRKYLDAVDQLVISAIPTGSRSLLDVGAGDGCRSRRIAHSCGISELVLVEPSVEMQRTGSAEARFHTMRAEELHRLHADFDVVLCLWNLVGHIFPIAARLEVFRQFARLLSPRGKIFLDVNHRYNIRHYGAFPTALRFLGDRFTGRVHGDVQVSWNLAGTRCTTRGHVFTHPEVMSLCRAAGLTIEERFVVDYSTGQQRRWSTEGNLLYVLRA